MLYCRSALYGTLFGSESEAAFSNYRLWESLGFVVAFAYSFYLCAAVKLYILTTVLVVGMLGYLAAEYRHWKSSIARSIDADASATSNGATVSETRETVADKSVDRSCSFINQVIRPIKGALAHYRLILTLCAI